MEAAEAKVGPEGLAAAQRLAGSVAFGPIAGHKGVFLCHILCELVEAGAKFARVERNWLTSFCDMFLGRHHRQRLVEMARPRCLSH